MVGGDDWVVVEDDADKKEEEVLDEEAGRALLAKFAEEGPGRTLGSVMARMVCAADRAGKLEPEAESDGEWAVPEGITSSGQVGKMLFGVETASMSQRMLGASLVFRSTASTEEKLAFRDELRSAW